MSGINLINSDVCWKINTFLMLNENSRVILVFFLLTGSASFFEWLNKETLH